MREIKKNCPVCGATPLFEFLSVTDAPAHVGVLWKSADPKETSRPGESEGAFRGRLRELARESRDLEVEKLRQRYAPKLARLAEQIQRAEQRIGRGVQVDAA